MIIINFIYGSILDNKRSLLYVCVIINYICYARIYLIYYTITIILLNMYNGRSTQLDT
jgi:hypothetical protein